MKHLHYYYPMREKELGLSGLQIYDSSEKRNNLDFYAWSFLFHSGKPRIVCWECKILYSINKEYSNIYLGI